MDDALMAAASEVRRNYDRCTAAILARDANAFIAAFGPAARGETAEGVAVTMAQTYDYWVWRFARTVTVHRFVVEFERVERSSDDVRIDFTEDSSATVLDAHGEPVFRTTHSVNRVVWRRENGAWSQVRGAELDVSRTIDGVAVTPDQDPIGVPAYRASQPGTP